MKKDLEEKTIEVEGDVSKEDLQNALSDTKFKIV